jgi:RNA polymerase sigma-70 factor (ECF subfamily)
MTATSTGLLERLKDHADADAWRRFANLYSPLLYGWLRRCSLADTDADDLVQEVMGVVATELSQFEHNHHLGAFRSWLRKVLVHRLRDLQRSRRARAVVRVNSKLLAQLADELEDADSRLCQAWNRAHDQHVARKLLNAIEPDFQSQTWRAFRRVALDGADPEAVAVELGISIASVYAAKSRVLKRLRQECQRFID